MEVGSLADWVAGMGSICAVIVAVGFWSLDKRASRKNKLLAVSAWVEKSNNNVTENGWKIIIVNGTEQPIFKWNLSINWKNFERTYEEYISYKTVGIIPPGRTEYPWSPHDTPFEEALVATKLRFQDINTALWARDSQGNLKKIKSIE